MDNDQAVDTDEPTTTLVPPPPAHAGEPQVTVDDPSAGGYYCGARRAPQQLAQAVESGDPNPWPWCRNRAGRGTDHVGIGSCRNHGGATPTGRAAARLRLAELVDPALVTLARAMAGEGVPWHTRVRAAMDVLDRAGYPRRMEVDIEEARDELFGDLLRLQASDEATS